MNSSIKILHDPKGLKFYADVDDAMAHVDYRHYRNDFIFVHTFVPDQLRGQGIASRIAETALAFVREAKKKIVLYCPFMLQYVKDHPEYNDLVDSTIQPFSGLHSE